jgi:predicted dehydrogenase
MSENTSDDSYGLSPEKTSVTLNAPNIPYAPILPRNLDVPIGIIGAGGISAAHLSNYKRIGLNVVAIADAFISAAEKRRDEFFPEADVYDDAQTILDRSDISVVDITPHPKDRVPLVRKALKAGKHVLSQKPFVLDLQEGHELIALAEKQGCKLAVNQNGRWAPHFSYMREAVRQKWIGEIVSVDFTSHWDHTWIKGNPGFEMRHMLLYDFAVHWFDILQCFMDGKPAEQVFAAIRTCKDQVYTSPSLGSVIINYPDAQARMSFNAHSEWAEEDTIILTGTQGTLVARAPGLNSHEKIELHNREGHVTVPLDGSWFEQGFEGTMAEFLCAIEDDREPYHSAANNIGSLELCFAAIASADSGEPKVPGEVTMIEKP